MDHHLICTWLGLPAESWPPDHYRLLGLAPGESDLAVIEHQVHQRLEVVRRYQLIHPEPATEAMNRLAQALVCLSDPAAKRVYDASFLVPAAGVPAPVEVVPTEATSADLPAATASFVQASIDTQIDAAPAPLDEASPAEVVPVEEPRETASVLRTAQRGLGTKRALYHRIAQTRKLLRAWEQAGRYLADPSRRINRPSEATELIHVLPAIRKLLRSFPPLLGVAGQPGYLVVSLARQPVIVPTFQTLLPSQREALARDWRAGHKLLIEHRQFLRGELRALRKRSAAGQVFRAVRTFVADRPGLILLVIAGIALGVALWKQVGPSSLRTYRTPPPATNR
jgi:hypothetical protein